MTVQLPPFPVDDSTLDLLSTALDPREHGDPEAETSSVGPLLRMLGEMHGADYHDHDVLRALIAEVRRQRASHVEARIDREDDLWIEIDGRWCCFLAGGARHRGLDALEEEFGPTSAVTDEARLALLDEATADRLRRKYARAREVLEAAR